MPPDNDTPLGIPASLWIATTKPLGLAAEFSETPTRSDVVIVGGGIAGLTTAYLLQRQNISVVVVEKDRIVEGVTGHTTAKVTSLHRLIYDQLIRVFGTDKARLYGEANQMGLQTIVGFAQQLGIECDLKRVNAYTFANKTSELDAVDAEVAAAQQLGLPVEFMSQIPIPILSYGAVMFREQAQFHPRKYLLGLARAFVAAGGTILENTRVTAIEENGSGAQDVEIKTMSGSLFAGHVVIASHYPIYDPALYFTRLSPHRSCVIAMTLDQPTPEGMFISSMQAGYSFRNHTEDNQTYWLMGDQHYKTGQGGNILQRYAQMTTYAHQHFAIRQIHYHWATQDNATLDGLPYIGKISPNNHKVSIAAGFGGWGMTNGTAAGILLSDQIMGKENPWSELFDPNRVKPLASAGSLITEGLNTAKHFVRGWMPKGNASKLAGLVPGEGVVIDSEEGKLAVSMDPDGALHCVSAICTHLGCVVNWNNGESSWDCPCHGSRFDAKGKVLHSPAVHDLAIKPLPDALTDSIFTAHNQNS